MKRKPYNQIRLSKKQILDVKSMEYFIPTTSKKRIYPNDRTKMAILSSKGVEPENVTRGFTLLKYGRTYRDEQITSYQRDIRLGYITKFEIIDSMPTELREWINKKIRGTPYDEGGTTRRMAIAIARKTRN